ncbi:zinc finger protein 704 isoform X3 [Drosophila ananassae]|nr:zinc finger protein 704 isoform X3 [Drosophila ananassae]
MSTGRRLAKRSIIGTKVCAPGPDGLWYSGVISDVKTPPTAAGKPLAPLSPPPPPTFLAPGDTHLNADTRYIVRFDFKTAVAVSSSSSSSSASTDSSVNVAVESRRANVHISPAQALRRNAMIKEFGESDLIGPGFRSIMGIQLQPGQRVFLTYLGREQSGDVVQHDASKDEVVVKITTTGNEEPIELKKRLEEVRLLESRRSARLADQDRDTDFARLADMSGDRRRTTTHSIEVPSPLTPQHNSRKRPPSDHQDYGPSKEVELNAAMILMNLKSHEHKLGADKWHELSSSPGSSSSASWSSGSASPPLSDDGHAHHSPIAMSSLEAASARIRTTSVSTSDEGIVSDFKEERKKKSKKFRCLYGGCDYTDFDHKKIQRHVRKEHLRKKARSGEYDSCSEHEEDFYYDEEDEEDEELDKTTNLASEPTLSHRDMARPPHEDPEYQKQIVGNFKQGRSHYNRFTYQRAEHHIGGGTGTSISGSNSSIPITHQQQLQNNNTSCTPSTHLVHHDYTWPAAAAMSGGIGSNTTGTGNNPGVSSTSPLSKHARSSSTRPSLSVAPYPSPTSVQQQQHHNNPHTLHHNYAGSSGTPSSSCSSSSSPVIHRNSSANNMLQQLSQQNVTVTAHHHQQQQQHHHQQQQQHLLSSVTITPNYNPAQQHHSHHQQMRHQQTTAGNMVAHNHSNNHTSNSSSSSNNSSSHSSGSMHMAVQPVKHTPHSPGKRTRGENKKCRKVYGMDKRDQWCTQCRWKKACSRFGD